MDKKEIRPQYIRDNDSCLLTPPNTQEKGPSLTPLEYVDIRMLCILLTSANVIRHAITNVLTVHPLFIDWIDSICDIL